MSTRDAILSAAREAFNENGAEGWSLRDVARSVGITPMAVYRHYRDKQALVEALVQDGLDEWSAYVAALPPAAPLAWIKRIGMAHLEFALRRPRRYEAAFLTYAAAARRYPDDFVAGRSPAGALQLKLIATLIERGQLAKVPPIEILLGLSALAQGLITLYRAGRIAGGEAAFRRLYARSLTRYMQSFRPAVRR